VQGAAFFSLMRDLTANGFFTTQAGIKDLDYQGNKPNEWDGVPADVLKHYGLAYDEKLLPLYLKMEDRSKIMTWG
jgi:gluconate 2-dehydrogenase gamma chain